MIEKTYSYTLEAKDLFEPLIEQDDFRINHVVIPPNKFFPKHPTDARVYIIIIEGELNITLADQNTRIYKKGEVIEVPKGIESILGNSLQSKTEVFVIKR